MGGCAAWPSHGPRVHWTASQHTPPTALGVNVTATTQRARLSSLTPLSGSHPLGISEPIGGAELREMQWVANCVRR